MIQIRKLTFKLSILALGLFYIATPTAAQTPTELAGRTISMQFVRADDFEPVAWPTEPVTLVTQAVLIKRDDSLFRLLEQRGIRTDTEALTLVYDLNPTIEKLEPLTPGATLLLPKMDGGSQFRKLIDGGNIVALTVDQQTKAQFAANTISITQLSSIFATLAPARFANPSKSSETISQVQDLKVWFEHIRMTFGRRTAKPLRQPTLLQIHYEADVLKSILTKTVTLGKPLRAADQSQISLLHSDIGKAIEKWDETMAGGLAPGDAQYDIVVEIVGGNVNRIQRLRVYYVPWGLFRTPMTNPPVRASNFRGLGQNSTATLPTKDYKVWAAPDGDPLNPATPPADLYVRKPSDGNAIKLTLSLNP